MPRGADGLVPPDIAPEAAAIRDLEVALTYGDLVDDRTRLRAAVPRGAVVSLRACRARTVAAALVSLDGWAARVELWGALGQEEVARVPDAGEAETVVVVDAAPGAALTDAPSDVDVDGVPTLWRLFTSGTTGRPKEVDHSLQSLTRTVRRSPPGAPPRRWGLLYEPTRMAGLQVLLQSLAGGDLLVDAAQGPRLLDRLHFLAAERVDALSATPTLWRQILQSGAASSLPLRQVTLGGEIAEQGLLDSLARTYPDARVTHVFASTETGAAFAVSDGREGFPRSYLTDPPRSIRLEVRDQILYVHAPGTSAAGPDGFASTGDLVEVTTDRVRFMGRASGLVNVAGVKVAPEEVEVALRRHSEVADAVVRAKRNPFSGWILVAEVVPTVDAHTDDLAARLRSALTRDLSAAHTPAAVRLVPALRTSLNGKAAR